LFALEFVRDLGVLLSLLDEADPDWKRFFRQAANRPRVSPFVLHMYFRNTSGWSLCDRICRGLFRDSGALY
jgi:hypothetical protein